MHLQKRTDFAIRLLVHLAVAEDEVVPVARVAHAYGISEPFLAKVAQALRDRGHVRAVRGRRGGLALARAPADIRIGQVVRELEDLTLVECFDPDRDDCAITPACRLRPLLEKARAAFLAVLDESTLDDLIRRRRSRLVQLLSPAS